MLHVNVTNERIQNAYQDVIEGRPSATVTVLVTNSVREAVELALSLIETTEDYETVRVLDDIQGNLYELRIAQVAMNAFQVRLDGEHPSSDHRSFQALGKIETTAERNQLWERMNHVRYNKAKSIK